MKLLHIVATPRGEQSNTMQISSVFIDQLSAKHPALEIDTLNVFDAQLPPIGNENIAAKYGMMMQQELNDELQAVWQPIEHHVNHFLSADIYLITAPIWNFTIPYALKHYIDTIVQPGYLFRYNEQGQPEGMVQNKRMVCITSRGGDYSENTPMHAYDFQEPYLRAIFGFVGVYDIQFVNVQPVDINPDLREMAVSKALADVSTIVAELV
ncbi:MAG: NAD(P)H-dependent oxidoreductase [Chloroflexota bacterium]